MKKLVNPDLIIIAREAAGFTQADLAREIGVDQGNLSRIENGFLQTTDDIIQKIAKVLTFPIEYFYESKRTYSPQVHYFRKSKALPAKELSTIQANAIIDRFRIEKLLSGVEIATDYYMMDLAEYETPEAIAKTLRINWKISRGPILNLTRLLESKGILIVPINFGNRLISDLTTKTENDIYIIYLNSMMPTDRKRFTLAHALGHVVMHNHSSSELIEDEADKFAGEFLMPGDEIRSQLFDLDLRKLAELKRYWKVSMQALIMRATQLGTINKGQQQYLWRMISAKGYRLKEPEEPSIKNEEPSLLYDMIDLYKTELSYSIDQLGRLIYLRNVDFSKYNLVHAPGIRLLTKKDLQ